MKLHLLSISVLATVLSAIGLIVSQPALAQSTSSVTQVSPTVVRVVTTGIDRLPEPKVVTTDRGLVITSIPTPITAKEDDAELEINVVDRA